MQVLSLFFYERSYVMKHFEIYYTTYENGQWIVYHTTSNHLNGAVRKFYQECPYNHPFIKKVKEL